MVNKVLVTVTIILFITTLYGLFSTNEIIICQNGDVVEDALDCPIDRAPAFPSRQAEAYIDNYGRAYSQAKGLVFTRVNTYVSQGDYLSQTIFTDREGAVHEATLKVDGNTGSVTCVENCGFLTDSQT